MGRWLMSQPVNRWIQIIEIIIFGTTNESSGIWSHLPIERPNANSIQMTHTHTHASPQFVHINDQRILISFKSFIFVSRRKSYFWILWKVENVVCGKSSVHIVRRLENDFFSIAYIAHS